MKRSRLLLCLLIAAMIGLAIGTFIYASSGAAV